MCIHLCHLLRYHHLDVTKRRLPLVVGVKIQHKGTLDPAKAASGYQLWYPGVPSRWFSYGSGAAPYSTYAEALSAGIDWVWAEHANTVGKATAERQRAQQQP